HDSSVDDSSVAEKHFPLPRWQDDLGDARRHEVTLAHENPKLRSFAVLDDHLVGRQGGPTDTLPTVAPQHPTGPPLRARNPHPAKLVVFDPTTIMIGHQTPFGLLIIGCPIPPVVL